MIDDYGIQALKHNFVVCLFVVFILLHCKNMELGNYGNETVCR